MAHAGTVRVNVERTFTLTFSPHAETGCKEFAERAARGALYAVKNVWIDGDQTIHVELMETRPPEPGIRIPIALDVESFERDVRSLREAVERVAHPLVISPPPVVVAPTKGFKKPWEEQAPDEIALPLAPRQAWPTDVPIPTGWQFSVRTDRGMTVYFLRRECDGTIVNGVYPSLAATRAREVDLGHATGGRNRWEEELKSVVRMTGWPVNGPRGPEEYGAAVRSAVADLIFRIDRAYRVLNNPKPYVSDADRVTEALEILR